MTFVCALPTLELALLTVAPRLKAVESIKGFLMTSATGRVKTTA